MKKKSIIWSKLTDDEFRELIKKSKSYSDILRYFFGKVHGGNIETIKKRMKFLNIDKIFYINLEYNFSNNAIPLKEVMVKNSTYSRQHLKRRLLEEGLLKHECSICGQEGNWKGKELIMILDHINGIPNDHRIDNLRMVCPNCNSQLDTFCGKHKSKKISLCSCGNIKSKHSKQCRKCSYENRKITNTTANNKNKRLIIDNGKQIWVDKNDEKYLQIKKSKTNKKISEEHKKKISEFNKVKMKGCGNSQYNTCWIHNLEIKESKKIKKEDLQNWLDKGWIKGRKIIW